MSLVSRSKPGLSGSGANRRFTSILRFVLASVDGSYVSMSLVSRSRPWLSGSVANSRLTSILRFVLASAYVSYVSMSLRPTDELLFDWATCRP